MKSDARTDDLERTLARLSANEMVSAFAPRAPAAVRGSLRAAMSTVSRPLGRALARFDARIDSLGPAGAAARVLGDLGARWTRSGPRPPPRGPLLVVANHPGAYDALVLLAALGRDDVDIIAADRMFLRAMPSLRRHLILVPDVEPGRSAPNVRVAERATAMGRAGGLRLARARLKSGGVVVQFGAGRIEPDPAFSIPPGVERLAPWLPGTGALVRGAASAGGVMVAALVEGVHSPRAKRAWLTGFAERRGVTTIAPLLQVALRPYRDVAATVQFADAVVASDLAGSDDDARIAARVRDRALALWPSVGEAQSLAECGGRLPPDR